MATVGVDARDRDRDRIAPDCWHLTGRSHTMDDHAFHATLAALREELRAVEERATKIRTAIQTIEDLLPVPSGARATSGTLTVTKRAGTVTVPTSVDVKKPDDPTYPDAAVAVLDEAGKPLHIKDLLARFKARGWYQERVGQGFRNSVVGSLDRKANDDDTFFKPAPATYALIKWRAEPEIATNGNAGGRGN